MNENMSRYKSDWQEAAQRMTDWWAGKTVDRTLACITAPVDPPANCRSKKLMTAVPDTRTDPATLFNNHDYLLEHTFWGAEAFPFVKVSLGPLFSVAYLGCKPNFDERTTWYTPCYRDIDDLAQNFTYDPDNYWWTFVKDMVRQSAARSAGGYLTTGTTVCAIIDDMAELIGMENLLVALLQEPEQVKTALRKIKPLVKSTFDALYTLTHPAQTGCMASLGVWSPKKIRVNQCDLSVSVSPHIFEDIILEDLASGYEGIDHGIYHLDGEEQIRHLDLILSLEEVHVVQWVPSARPHQPDYGDPLNWLELFKRIQDAGKSALIRCPAERVAALLQKVDRQKTILGIRCPDVQSAQQTLRLLDDIGV